MKQREQDNEIERLMNNLGNKNDPNNELKALENQLRARLKRTLTKEDVPRLAEIDDGIVSFICFIRSQMLWYDKKLDHREIEVLFGFLNAQHKKIIQNLRRLVNDFCASRNAFGASSAAVTVD